MKPTLDLLEGFVYPDDRNITYLESVHLDMQSFRSSDSYFGIDVNMDNGLNHILKIYTETCFLIEAGIIRPGMVLPILSV